MWGRCGVDYLQDMATRALDSPSSPTLTQTCSTSTSACIAKSPAKALTATYGATGAGGKAPYWTVNGSGTTSDITPLVTEIKKALVQTRSCSFAMTAKLPTGVTTGVKITTNAGKGKFSYNGTPPDLQRSQRLDAQRGSNRHHAQWHHL